MVVSGLFSNIAAAAVVVVVTESWSTEFVDAIFTSHFHLITESKEEVRFFQEPCYQLVFSSTQNGFHFQRRTKKTIIIIFNCVIHAKPKIPCVCFNFIDLFCFLVCEHNSHFFVGERSCMFVES